MCQNKNEVINYYRYINIPGQGRVRLVIKCCGALGMDWTGQLDRIVELDNCSGQLDWTVGLESWTGLLDWILDGIPFH